MKFTVKLLDKLEEEARNPEGLGIVQLAIGLAHTGSTAKIVRERIARLVAEYNSNGAVNAQRG